MPVVKNILDFSPDGVCLAYSSPDGCLKIWETATNLLKQEYTPSSHLSATCSCISWYPRSPIKHASHSSKRHKKEKGYQDSSAIEDLQLLAMGTLTGDILLYSYVKADLFSCLTNGHSSVVNDVCWCTSSCSLYSCSSDKNIIIWDVFTGKVKTKWKADNAAVQSISVIDSKNLLSASNSIKWWDVEQKTVIKTFTGHASEIFRLIPLKNEEKLENSYFLSAAVGDRVINAWQLNNENQRAVASFVVSDEPENISVLSGTYEPLLLSVVCKDGSFQLFEHILNGYKKKPISSKVSIQIASKSNDSLSKPERISILCSTLSMGLSSSLMCYGSFLRPTFERIDLSDVSNDLFLIRDSSSSARTHNDAVTRIKNTDNTEKVKLLAPGHLTPGKDAQNILRKRKKRETSKTEELPMEERLRALDLSKIPPLEEQESTLKADSMVHLLLQGLQSKDSKMINTVLQSTDDRIIQNTLKRLPLQSIIVLIKELHIRLNRKEQRNHPYIKWMKGLLSIHLPYLMSCKDINEYLGPINQIIQARIENFPKMCQLHGCLKILLSQTAVNNIENVVSDQPLAVYQSDSSEESDAEELDHNEDGIATDEELANDEESSSSSESESSDDGDMEA